MIIPDTNLLIYTYNRESVFHEPAVAWWNSALNNEETVGLANVVILGFVRILTNRHNFKEPASIESVLKIVEEWLEHPNISLVDGNKTAMYETLRFLRESGAGGNLSTDAHIASIAIQHRATVHTNDTDFRRFEGVKVFNPLLPKN